MHASHAPGGAVRSRAEILSHLADKALLYALGIVFVVALLLGVVNGWARGSNLSYKIGWAAFAAAVVCVEFGAIKKAIGFYKAGDYKLAAVAATAAFAGFCMSCFATFNSAVTNLDQANVATIKKDDAYKDARGAKKKAEELVETERHNVEQLRANLAAAVPKVSGQPITTIGAAEQLITRAQQDRWWERTESCTKTLGRETSKFCSDYREAVAARETLSSRGKDETKVSEAEGRLTAALAAVKAAEAQIGGAPPVTSRESPFVRTLQKKFDMEPDDAALIEAGLPSVSLQILLMFLGLIASGSPERLDEADGHTVKLMPSQPAASVYPISPYPGARQAIASQRALHVTVDPGPDVFGNALSRVRGLAAA